MFVQPPTCTTYEDYKNLAKFRIMRSGANEINAEAKQQCPNFCTRLVYKVEVKEDRQPSGQLHSSSLTDSATSDMLYFEDLWWSWDIVLMSSTVTTISQFFSYDQNQFIAELGGTWGLFLGLSLTSIFEIVEYVLARLAVVEVVG